MCSPSFSLFLLDATAASWGLYQLVFVCAALLGMYSAFLWYEGNRDKHPEGARRGKLLFLLAVVAMVATAFVSVAVTRQLPF